MTSMAAQVLGSILPKVKDWKGGGGSIKEGEESVEFLLDSKSGKFTSTTSSVDTSHSSPLSTMPTVIKKYKAAAVTAEPGVGVSFLYCQN